MFQRVGFLDGKYEFIWTSCCTTWVFLRCRFSVILEILAMIMSFDLNSTSGCLLIFLYQVKDSDKIFANFFWEMRDKIVFKIYNICFVSVLSRNCQETCSQVPLAIEDGRQYVLKLGKPNGCHWTKIVLRWWNWWSI